MIPNVLVIGEPGSGKSVAAARDALEFPGVCIIQDPHQRSLARLVLTHAPADNIIFDRLSDLEHSIGYDLLKPSRKASVLDAIRRTCGGRNCSSK